MQRLLAAMVLVLAVAVGCDEDKPVTPLYSAVEQGWQEGAKVLLEAGADPLAFHGKSPSPLFLAVANNDVDMVRLMAAQGADLNSRDATGVSLVRTAEQEDAGEVLAFLLEAKVKRDVFDAALLGEVATVRSFLENGGDPNIQDRQGTPLAFFAVKQEKIAALLLEAKADFKVLGPLLGDGAMDVIHLAAEFGWRQVLERELAQGAALDGRDGNGRTPLLIALSAGEVSLSRFLMDQGANINARNHEGETPLLVACDQGLLDLARTLLERGADVTARDETGQGVFHKLLAEVDDKTWEKRQEERMELWEQLKQRWPEGINQTDLNGGTALHLAVKGEHLKALTFLLERGANPQLKNDQGETPLHLAAERGDPEGILVLLSYGASKVSQDDKGRTPLLTSLQEKCHPEASLPLMDEKSVRMANDEGQAPLEALWSLSSCEEEEKMALLQRMGQAGAPLKKFSLGAFLGEEPEAVRLLVKKGLSPTVFTAAYMGDLAVLKRLLRVDGAGHIVDSEGDTPLHYAAFAGQAKAAALLLSRGGSWNATDESGQTPLHKAAQSGDATFLHLLPKGEEGKRLLAMTDEQGRRPLHMAAEAGHAVFAAGLLERGAAVNVQDEQGDTPLHLAAQEGSVETAQGLVGAGASLDIKNQDGAMALQMAFSEGEIETADWLVSQGADINAANDWGLTQLQLWVLLQAATGKEQEKADEVSDEERDGQPGQESQSEKKEVDAEEKESVDEIREGILHLLNTGAQPDLLTWVVLGDVEQVKMALASGVSVNAVHPLSGCLPLHAAVKMEDLAMVRLLVQEGSRLDVRCSWMKTLSEIN